MNDLLFVYLFLISICVLGKMSADDAPIPTSPAFGGGNFNLPSRDTKADVEKY